MPPARLGARWGGEHEGGKRSSDGGPLRRHVRACGGRLPFAVPWLRACAEAAVTCAISSRQDKEKAVNVQVLLRCRPFSDDELRNNALQLYGAVTQSIDGKQFDQVFSFDKVCCHYRISDPEIWVFALVHVTSDAIYFRKQAQPRGQQMMPRQHLGSMQR